MILNLISFFLEGLLIRRKLTCNSFGSQVISSKNPIFSVTHGEYFSCVVTFLTGATKSRTSVILNSKIAKALLGSGSRKISLGSESCQASLNSNSETINMSCHKYLLLKERLVSSDL